MKRILCALLLLVLAGTATAQHWFDPAEPGHGVNVQAVGDDYVLQWYAHCGYANQCWFVTDVSPYGHDVPLYTSKAQSWPAQGARLELAGFANVSRVGDGLRLEYAVDVPEISCWQLPGPRPPVCKDRPDGIVRPAIAAFGVIDLEILVE